jgi:hypothetical protein
MSSVPPVTWRLNSTVAARILCAAPKVVGRSIVCRVERCMPKVKVVPNTRPCVRYRLHWIMQWRRWGQLPVGQQQQQQLVEQLVGQQQQRRWRWMPHSKPPWSGCRRVSSRPPLQGYASVLDERCSLPTCALVYFFLSSPMHVSPRGTITCHVSCSLCFPHQAET